MKKALPAAAVALAAVIGVIAAVVVSSGGGSNHAAPGSASSTGTRSGTAGTGTRPAGTTAGGTTTGEPTGTLRLPPPPGPKSPKRRTFVVGVVDDALEQQDPSFAQSQVDVSRDAGFDAVVVSAAWAPARTRPSATVLRELRNVVAATRRDHMRMFVVVWNGFARTTPRTPSARADFAEFAAALLKAVPTVRDVIVGNEPNLNTFWMPQFGPGGRDVAALGYEDLLARTYDALKAVSPHVRVIGGTVSPRGADRPNGIRQTHSPTAFITDLGRAYRASGRDRPLMDAFAFHPYMQVSRVPPTLTHPRSTSITIADYPKLVTLLDRAFSGTAQPGARLPVLYTEFGVQTRVPRAKRSFYQGGGTPDAADVVGFETQSEYYRRALALSYCQPTVRGFFVFHTFDEPDLNGWQSGLYFADRTPKPSLPEWRRAVADLRKGELTSCP